MQKVTKNGERARGKWAKAIKAANVQRTEKSQHTIALELKAVTHISIGRQYLESKSADCEQRPLPRALAPQR
jgi:hypothetical protein